MSWNNHILFRYAYDLAEVHRQRAVPLLIVAGRGTGKSLFLSRLREMLSDDFPDENSILIVNGRYGEPARARILDDHQPRRVVLVDDIDVLLTAQKGDRPELITKIRDKLLRSVMANSAGYERGSWLVATCTIEVATASEHRLSEALGKSDEARAWIDEYSRLTMNLTRRSINPWNGNWKELWERDFNSMFGALAPPLLKIWRTSILNLTGGHPALFGTIIEHLHSLLGTETSHDLLVSPSPQADPAQLAKLQEAVSKYAEAYILANSARYMGSLLREIRDSTNEIEARGFELLSATYRGHAEPLIDINVQRVLGDRALIDRQAHPIPGSVMRTLVFQAVRHRRGSIILKPDSPDGRGRAHGEIVVHSATGDQRTIRLSGAPWRLFRTLCEHPNETLDQQTLLHAIGFRSMSGKKRLAKEAMKKAIANAVQRLHKELRTQHAEQLASMIENDRGKGYRLKLGSEVSPESITSLLDTRPN